MTTHPSAHRDHQLCAAHKTWIDNAGDLQVQCVSREEVYIPGSARQEAEQVLYKIQHFPAGTTWQQAQEWGTGLITTALLAAEQRATERLKPWLRHIDSCEIELTRVGGIVGGKNWKPECRPGCGLDTALRERQ